LDISLEFRDVGMSLSVESFACLLLEANGLHGVGGLVNGVPASHLVGLGVEGLVAVLELWSILGVVLWSDDGEGLVGHWVVFLTHLSGLNGFLLETLESFTHLGEHVELHEVLREGAVAVGIIISILAITGVGEAGDGFVVVVRVGFGRGDVGALALGVVSGPLSAVVGSIAEGSAVSVHETIVGEVHERVEGQGVHGVKSLNPGNLLLVGRVVAEVDEHLLVVRAVNGDGVNRFDGLLGS